MARLITKFKYFRQANASRAAKYAKYIAYREGAESCRDSHKHESATKAQCDLIQRILKDFPDSKDMHEYDDYQVNPTRENAHEFITRVLEDNAPNMDQRKTYADYIATRPRAERVGRHALFSIEDAPISLQEVSEELQNHKGNIWTVIVSLRREDAEALGYNTANQWRDTLRKHTQELADALRIPVTELKWYAAFHNESHHPHIHLIAYTDDPKKGYLHRNGIMRMRSALAKDIFADELLHAYKRQTAYRDQLKKDWDELVNSILERIKARAYHNPELEQKLLELAEKLPSVKGKKVYGYLPKHLRDLVNSIVDLLAKDPNIKELYGLWYEKKCEARQIYTTEIPEQEPLSENQEFKSIKNSIIKEALGLHYEQQKSVSPTVVTRLLNDFGKLFQDGDIHRKEQKPSEVDRKLIREEEAKRKGENYYLS